MSMFAGKVCGRVVELASLMLDGRLDATLAATSPVPVPKGDVTVGVPADLLRRRPDVRRAERALAFDRAAQLYRLIADLQGAPDLSLRGELPAYGALLIGGASARALVEQGRLLREGPARALADFARAFGLTP